MKNGMVDLNWAIRNLHGLTIYLNKCQWCHIYQDWGHKSIYGSLSREVMKWSHKRHKEHIMLITKLKLITRQITFAFEVRINVLKRVK